MGNVGVGEITWKPFGRTGLNVPPNARVSCLPSLQHNARGQRVDTHGNVISECFYDSGSPRMGVGVGISWISLPYEDDAPDALFSVWEV